MKITFKKDAITQPKPVAYRFFDSVIIPSYDGEDCVRICKDGFVSISFRPVQEAYNMLELIPLYEGDVTIEL